jgi:multicomponent Na+:H+ antiporter subunit G
MMGPAAIVLLSFAAGICLLSCFGMTAMKGFYDRLHYLAPPATLAMAAVAGAILVEEGLSPSSLKVLLILLVMIISNPVLTHAAARANFLRSQQDRED